MAHSHREFRTQDIPIAYLISSRAYGTWLHGDKRGSVDRFHFKANATREMREAGCWHNDRSPWIPRGSKKYLWDEESVSAAVAYVLYEQ